jgi:hypothetical protein
MTKKNVSNEFQRSYKKLHEIIKDSSTARQKRVQDLIGFGTVLIKGGFDEGENQKNTKEMIGLYANYKYLISECYDGDEGQQTWEEDLIYSAKRANIECFGLGEKSLAEKVREWVSFIEGSFCVQECYTSFNCVQRHEKERIRVILHRLHKDKGLIERNGGRGGTYRVVKEEAPSIDIMNLDTSTFNIHLPLDLHELVKIQPKNIIIIAGESDAGKSCFCLNVAKENIGRGYDVRYLTSEMGGAELAYRLKCLNLKCRMPIGKRLIGKNDPQTSKMLSCLTDSQ